MDSVLSGALALALLALIYLPLERLFPAHEQAIRRKEWGTDLLFFLGQHFLWTAPVVLALVAVGRWTNELPLAGVRQSVGAWPLWLQILTVVVLCDVCIYWAHRWSHSSPFLWRFHRVHHTAERLDFLAAYREHPFDNLFTRTVENLPAILLGFPLELIAGFALFRGLWAVYIHSNTSLDPGPLRYLLGSPRLHHWHHDVGLHSRINFANLSPLMDLVFGTYHDPGHMPGRYGVHARIRHGYLAQLVEPILGFRMQTPERSPVPARIPVVLSDELRLPDMAVVQDAYEE
ncbi:Fatty acid hydroxylase superfamily protein [Planctomycetes bacterium Poly30]|uniref:Fatty acid hydroxylase superfamily protein n=1 Tax=Saltatorellus ferox TaxID=2528018 RepID=A0A518ELU7_9BACT|nr:Fatty acid hydroxylase superfamily protein [Planctomycetes bacterium Poly30]